MHQHPGHGDPLPEAQIERAAMQQCPEGTRMTARAYHLILKLARTIADLGGSERIQTIRLAEAIQYRPSRRFWRRPLRLCPWPTFEALTSRPKSARIKPVSGACQEGR